MKDRHKYYKLTCYRCGKEFITNKNTRGTIFKKSFCNQECYIEYIKESNQLKGIQIKGPKNFSQEFIEESRKRMIGNTYRLGTKLTNEHKEKISKANRGEKCHLWKGGISREIKEYGYLFNRQLKEKIRVRDNFKCQICGIPELELNYRLSVHHIDYNKKNMNIDNLISLCKSCHNKTNIKREYYQELLQKGKSD
jgi:hypothetical protein